jgi:hypothetical protein
MGLIALIVNLGRAWRNREGLRYWRLFPLRSKVLLSVVLVLFLVVTAVLVSAGVHAISGGAPSYYCQNVAVQPSHGCQKDGVTVNP